MNENTVNQVIDKSFQTSPDTVYGILIIFMFVGLIVLVLFLTRERKDRKEANKQLLEMTRSYAETFAQVNETLRNFGQLSSDIKDIKEYIKTH
jgi:hypothetical protein